jgi:hypothetical protein
MKMKAGCILAISAACAFGRYFNLDIDLSTGGDVELVILVLAEGFPRGADARNPIQPILGDGAEDLLVDFADYRARASSRSARWRGREI